MNHFSAEELARKLGGKKSGDGWVACCPAHEDRKPSLAINEKDGKVLVHCHANCSQNEVLDALRQRGLWPDKPQAGVSKVSKPHSTHDAASPPAVRSPQALWNGCSPASPSHPYLEKKCIRVHGARAAGDRLVLPLLDTEGAIHSLQYISVDGEKKFLTGSKTTGHFFLIGEAEPSAPLYIAEGFATAASIHKAMGGQQVAVAFNAGNLRPVAKALHWKWPDRPLVLCADNDVKTSGNPGLSAAWDAAQVVGGTVAVPDFGADWPAGAKDFNDLFIHRGPEAVCNSIQNAQSAFPALDGLVEKTMKDPGHPFQPEVLKQLKRLRIADRARFEALRADLKKRKLCRMTQLDQALKEQGDTGGDSRLVNRLAAIAGEALHDWDDVFLASEDRLTFADLSIDGRRETWPVDSDRFKSWLTMQCFSQTGDTPGLPTLNAVENLIRSQAHSAGRQRSVCIRSGTAEGKLYLDLCDEDWRCVEISKDGWQVIGSGGSPVRFRRYPAMDALPEPTRGGDIEALRPFVNVASDEDFVLLVAWVLAVLRSRGPYPVLVLSGEPGSAKSTVAQILRSLVDPSHVPTRVFPTSDEDLFLVASHNHLLAFDNLSSLSHTASDLLCQLATGGGFGTRQLYTNQEEFLLHANRPILLNGIENVAVRSDLADRAVCLTLEPIAEKDRRTESKLWASFEAERPRILGALLDAMVVGQNRLPDIQLPETPRMADFAQWAAACETAYWPEGTFLATYSGNRQEAMADVIESDPVADSIRLLASSQPLWEGTASELLSALEPLAGERTVKSKRWPANAQVLSRQLKRIAPALRQVGVEVSHESKRKGKERKRTVRIATLG